MVNVKGRYKALGSEQQEFCIFKKQKKQKGEPGMRTAIFSRKRQKNDVRNDVHVQMYVYVLYVLRKRKMCARCFGLNFAFIDRA